jgi:hypothetical protein
VISRFQSGSGYTDLKQTTVHFPSAGYYPIELDYTECQVGELEMVLDSSAANPIPNGPSPTPTQVCAVPTPFDYPWCQLLSTPTSAPSAPVDTISYYVEATFTPGPSATATPVGYQGYWYDRGVAEAERIIANGGPQKGLVILDFGEPAKTLDQPGVTWGARFARTDTFISVADITQLAGDFAQGFYDRVHSLTSSPRIVLAIGK